MWACVFAWCFQFMDDAFLCRSLPVLVNHEQVLFKKVTTQSNCLYTHLNEKSWVLTLWLCLRVSLCHYVISSKSWLQWNHRGEYVSWPLRMCIMLAIYFFPPISSKWSQWLLCITLEKLKDTNIFLAPSIEKAQTKMACLLRAASTSWWRVSVIRRGLENNNGNKGTKQVGFNEMRASRQYIPLCSSLRLLGSSTWRKPEKS